MGPIQSKNFASIVNDVSAEIIVKNMQNCTGSVDQEQILTGSGWNLFSSQKQDASINLSCAANFKMDANIVNQITNEIQQRANAAGIALLSVGGVKANTETEIRNRIATSITTEFVQQTVSRISQKQAIAWSGISVGASQRQSASNVQAALADSIASIGVGNSLGTLVDQRATAESKSPLDFLAGIFKWWVILILVIVIAVIGGAVYLLGD